MLPYLTERTEIGQQDECWPWLLSVGSHGYGNACWDHEVRTSHSLWWEAVTGYRLVGRQAEDLTLHHICHTKVCCNPNHLEVITNRENARMNGMVKQTHCRRGHPYDRRTERGPRCYRCARKDY